MTLDLLVKQQIINYNGRIDARTILSFWKQYDACSAYARHAGTSSISIGEGVASLLLLLLLPVCIYELRGQKTHVQHLCRPEVMQSAIGRVNKVVLTMFATYPNCSLIIPRSFNNIISNCFNGILIRKQLRDTLLKHKTIQHRILK